MSLSEAGRARRAAAGHRWPLRRVFTGGAAVAVLLSLLAVVLGGIAVARLYEARNDLLDQAAPAQTAAERLSLALVDQETGVRGYVLSGREEFLAPYRDGLAAQRAAVTDLRAFAAGRATPRVDAAEAAAERWRAGYAEPAVAAVRAGTPPPSAERGRMLFDAVRTESNAVLANRIADLNAARVRVGDAATFVGAVGAGIAVVLVVVLAAALVLLRRAVLTPVSRLAGETREVVSGGVQRTIHATGPREIVELGADVEAMRAHISAELDRQQEVNRLLDEQARDLERSNRDLEQFAYVASHDLQEPLRKVSSFCQLLQRRYAGQLDDRADQYIAFAVDGAQRMQRLINDLLAFSRVGRTTAAFEPVDLAVVARAAAAELEQARAEVDGTVEVGELPTVPGDPALLRQLFVNLVGNSLKFHRTGVPPDVRVTAREVAPERDGDGPRWEIAVTDNGIGIEPEYAGKVFVIFQRLHARDVYSGTGIGLALAKKIVEFHGGRIRLGDPPPGAGTTVLFTLPAGSPAPQEEDR